MGSLLSIYTQADLKAYVEGRLHPEDEEEIRALTRSDEKAREWAEYYQQQNRSTEMTEKLTKTEARQATENRTARRVLLVSMLIVAAVAILALVFGPAVFA